MWQKNTIFVNPTVKKRLMIVHKNGILVGFTIVFFQLFLNAQNDSIARKDSISLTKNVLVDSLKLQHTHQVNQEDLLVPQNGLQDNPLVQVVDTGKYNLQDVKEAAKYDSLWLTQLYKNTSLSDTIYAHHYRY